MELTFSGEVWFWRGPSPFHFVTVPEDESTELQAGDVVGDTVTVRLTVDV